MKDEPGREAPRADGPGTNGPGADERGKVAPGADEPGDGPPVSGEEADTGRADSPERDQLDRLLALIGPRVDDVRALLDEAGTRWRGDAVRVGEGTRQRLRDLARELGLVTREEWDELELRVAQLEHRLRLLEERSDAEEGGR